MDRVFQLSLTFISAQGHLEWHTALPAIQHSCCIALCELHPVKALLPTYTPCMAQLALHCWHELAVNGCLVWQTKRSLRGQQHGLHSSPFIPHAALTIASDAQGS
jgi:hypothetical protein